MSDNMSEHELLLKKVQEAMIMASKLSNSETDKYAKAIEELFRALYFLNK